MASDDIAPFPNPGVRLLREDEHVAVFEEVFEPGVPTAPHRHLRDYLAFFPVAGELTVSHRAGDQETYDVLAGAIEALPAPADGVRVAIAADTLLHSSVPAGGTAHVALNEGTRPLRMILVEIKSAARDHP